MNSSIGPNAWASMHANFDDYGDVRVLVVRCEKSRVPMYVKDGNSEQFFVRTGPSTTALTPQPRLRNTSSRGSTKLTPLDSPCPAPGVCTTGSDVGLRK